MRGSVAKELRRGAKMLAAVSSEPERKIYKRLKQDYKRYKKNG